MTQKQQGQLKTWGSLLGIVVVIAAAVSAIHTIKADASQAIKDVTRVESQLREEAKDAKEHAEKVETELREKAEKAQALAEQNARDFAYFKGEVNAKLDFIITNMKQQYDLIQTWEPADGKN